MNHESESPRRRGSGGDCAGGGPDAVKPASRCVKYRARAAPYRVLTSAVTEADCPDPERLRGVRHWCRENERAF